MVALGFPRHEVRLQVAILVSTPENECGQRLYRKAIIPLRSVAVLSIGFVQAGTLKRRRLLDHDQVHIDGEFGVAPTAEPRVRIAGEPDANFFWFYLVKE